MTELTGVVRAMKKHSEVFNFFLRACETGALKVCQACLDAGVDVNIKGDSKETVLISLVKSGNFTTKVADWLIKNGIDVNICDSADNSCFSYACCSGNYVAATYFIENGVRVQDRDLEFAVKGGNSQIFELIIDRGVDLNYSNDSGCNPYLLAIDYKNTLMVEFFLRKGADPNFYYFDMAPLHRAALKGDLDTAKLLLRYKADVNAKLKGDIAFICGDIALTAMDIAIIKKDEKMKRLLSLYGGAVSTEEQKNKFFEDRLMKKRNCVTTFERNSIHQS